MAGGDTRHRMVVVMADLLQRQGLGSTSFSDVLAGSGAARGAIYHHFPGGKAELVGEAVAWTGERIGRSFAQLETTDPAAVMTQVLELFRPVMVRAADGAGCAVAAVVMEAGQRDPDLTAAAGVAFASWRGVLAERLIASGASVDAAQSAAALLITVLEGAQVTCRAAGSVTPFDEAVGSLAPVLARVVRAPTERA